MHCKSCRRSVRDGTKGGATREFCYSDNYWGWYCGSYCHGLVCRGCRPKTDEDYRREREEFRQFEEAAWRAMALGWLREADHRCRPL